jgi:hypothetical protein
METITPTIKTRKPRTVKQAAPHVAAMKKAMSTALKAEHAYASAAGKIEKQIQELKQGLETKRAAAKEAWYQVHLTASDCVRAHEA